MKRERDLTTGDITTSLWLFALPLMLGNVMQQLYNLVDTWVVGRYIGDTALAAVGSSYTILTFLTSVIIGLCLGSSAFLSMAYGRRDLPAMRNGIFLSCSTIGVLSLCLMLAFYRFLDPIIFFLRVPKETVADMHTYLFYVFFGFFATFLYNYFSNVLRGIGNSAIPLLFLAVSVVLNIFLDLYCVIVLHWGIMGAALATAASQCVSGIGITVYFLKKFPQYRVMRRDMCWNIENLRSILSLSGCTCLQQSVMNFGILLVQGIVNSFGTAVMAAFAVAVKIDTIAYMPVQDFGNAFSVFVAQNYGAQKSARIASGVRCAFASVAVFCVIISSLVWLCAQPLMQLFVDASSAQVVRIGVQYLQIEGACYIGIGILFLLYGYYRAVNRPQMSVVLTVCSLGTRVALAYLLSGIAVIGVIGIWVSIPIGWFFADAVGIGYYFLLKKRQTHAKRDA